jgi:hypothetical protein
MINAVTPIQQSESDLATFQAPVISHSRRFVVWDDETATIQQALEYVPLFPDDNNANFPG